MTEIYDKSAVLSPCGKYRYSLTRVWDTSKSRVLWVMLNPSTADASVDDPTIRKCVGFAKKWGYGSIEVVNLFAMRATDPKELDGQLNPVGFANDVAIQAAVGRASIVVAAWGSNQFAKCRAKRVIEMLRALFPKFHVLRLNKDRSPAHPLYVPYDVAPVLALTGAK